MKTNLNIAFGSNILPMSRKVQKELRGHLPETTAKVLTKLVKDLKRDNVDRKIKFVCSNDKEDCTLIARVTVFARQNGKRHSYEKDANLIRRDVIFDYPEIASDKIKRVANRLKHLINITTQNARFRLQEELQSATSPKAVKKYSAKLPPDEVARRVSVQKLFEAVV